MLLYQRSQRSSDEICMMRYYDNRSASDGLCDRFADVIVGVQTGKPTLNIGRVDDRNLFVAVGVGGAFDIRFCCDTGKFALDRGRVDDGYHAVAVNVAEQSVRHGDSSRLSGLGIGRLGIGRLGTGGLGIAGAVEGKAVFNRIPLRVGAGLAFDIEAAHLGQPQFPGRGIAAVRAIAEVLVSDFGHAGGNAHRLQAGIEERIVLNGFDGRGNRNRSQVGQIAERV